MEDLQREMKAMAAEMGELRREVEQLRSSDNTGDVTINPLSDDEDRVSAGELELSRAVRSGFAQIVGAPTNLHQATTVILLDPEEAMSRKLLYVCGSFLVVLLQSQALAGVAYGIRKPSCISSEDCPQGDYCSTVGYSAADDVGGVCKQCLYDWNAGDCEGQSPELEGRVTVGFVKGPIKCHARDFCSLANLTSYPDGVVGCAGCFDPTLPGNYWNIGRSGREAAYDALIMMKAGDWLAMVLVAFVIGLYVSAEIRDITLCDFLTNQRKRSFEAEGKKTLSWAATFLWFLSTVRRFGFLPRLICTVPLLVVFRGSDAITICFNAVALLFILEIDDAIFGVFLPESTRSWVDINGRATIGEREAQVLAATKIAHTLLVTLAITWGVWAVGKSGDWGANIINGFLPFWFGRLAELAAQQCKNRGAGAGGEQKADEDSQGAGAACGGCGVGAVVGMVWYVLNGGLI